MESLGEANRDLNLISAELSILLSEERVVRGASSQVFVWPECCNFGSGCSKLGDNLRNQEGFERMRVLALGSVAEEELFDTGS